MQMIQWSWIFPGKLIKLYGKKSTIQYDDNHLEAPQIEYDQNTNLVRAHLTKDSTGKVIAYPTFTQADLKRPATLLFFNMDTRKGITKGTYTQQVKCLYMVKNKKK
jgi:hypothetical protein